MTVIKMPCPKVFDYKKCLDYFKSNENEVLFEVKGDEIIRALRINNQDILICISYTPHKLLINIMNEVNLTSSLRNSIIAYITEWFDFNTNLEVFYNYVKNNEVLNPLINEFYGLRLIRIPNFFEAISWGIIGQQINLAFAYQLKKRLVEKFGEKIKYKGKYYYIHPEPSLIAKCEVKDLMDLQFSRRKAEYLIGIAKLIDSKEISKEKYLKMNDKHKIESALVSIRGVGPWTAHYIMMRCLGLKNAFPIGDVGLQNALKKLLNLEEKPSKSKMLELNEDWNKWSSYATFYIWRAL